MEAHVPRSSGFASAAGIDTRINLLEPYSQRHVDGAKRQFPRGSGWRQDAAMQHQTIDN